MDKHCRVPEGLTIGYDIEADRKREEAEAVMASRSAFLAAVALVLVLAALRLVVSGLIVVFWFLLLTLRLSIGRRSGSSRTKGMKKWPMVTRKVL